MNDTSEQKSNKNNAVCGIIKQLAELDKKINAVYLHILKQWDLTMNGYLTLEIILESPDGIEPARMADELGVQRQLITQIINSFEKRELIRTKENLTDRRRKKILLTAKGKRFAQKVHNVILETDCHAMSIFSEEEQQTLIDFHRRFYAMLPPIK